MRTQTTRIHRARTRPPKAPPPRRETFLAGRVLAVVAVVCGTAAGALYYRTAATRIEAHEKALREGRRVDRLHLRASSDVDRRRLVDALTAEILRDEPTLAAARALAGIVVSASEKYPAVDPVLLAAAGVAELKRTDAKRPLAERGLYHLRPDVARRLAEEVGWTYDEHLLTDPERSAELAARHLAELQSAYYDPRMVVAEYDGGPLDAGYLRARVGTVSTRTKQFVRDVFDVYERLQTDLSPNQRRSLAGNGRPRRAGTLAEAESRRRLNDSAPP